jgi:hypothetical protein
MFNIFLKGALLNFYFKCLIDVTGVLLITILFLIKTF